MGDAVRLAYWSNRSTKIGRFLELRAQMPRVVTKATSNLMKSCGGATVALSIFFLALAPAPAAAQFVCGQAGTGSADGATATGASSVACGTGATASGVASPATGVLSTASGTFGTA